MIIVFFVRCHIDDLIGDHRIFRISLVNLSVRSLYKAVLVDPRIACKVVDQSDIWSFRSLYGTHSSVMGIMHIADLKSGTIPGQTTGAQG